jgi:hypothetical protein
VASVFLSYRRADTATAARRVYARLVQHFGDKAVFLDVENISLGDDFVSRIAAALDAAAYVLIAIGPRWLLVVDEAGVRRLDDPDDIVRYEVRSALQQSKRVVPMLIGGAKMPGRNALPADIPPLVRRNGIALRPDPDFEADAAALVDGLQLNRIDTRRVSHRLRCDQ